MDAPDPAYIPQKIIDTALEFIDASLRTGNQVLVHCNEGCSRSPAIGLLYLVKYTDLLPIDDFIQAEEVFRSIYPPYNPKNGIRGYMTTNWSRYASRSDQNSKSG
ncbi:MAG TPA: dual specificity protein phosphatase family protein [Methanoculleus sp.]|nr:dual specificity protein phosphatase family protein [Methanoculleus sp.]